MKNILIAVDETKRSVAAVTACASDICVMSRPEQITLLYVEKYEGRSLIDEMLGDAEMSTLRKALEGTEYKKKLDEKAETILEFHSKALAKNGFKSVKTIVMEGHPAEEILKAAKKTKADMIILGARSKRKGRLTMGSVSNEVANHADVPVLIVR